MREGLRLLMKFEPDFEEFLQGRAKLLAVGVDWASHEEVFEFHCTSLNFIYIGTEYIIQKGFGYWNED